MASTIALEGVVVEKTSTNHWKNINHILPSGETMLTALIETGDLGLISQTLSQGADTNQRNARGTSPLESAIRGSKTSIAEILIQHGASVNQASRFGFSLLEIALCHKNEEIVKLLLRYVFYNNFLSVTMIV